MHIDYWKFLSKIYSKLGYNIDHPPEDFTTEFFYMVGELLNGKRMDELNPGGHAAETLKELLAEQREKKENNNGLILMNSLSLQLQYL